MREGTEKICLTSLEAVTAILSGKWSFMILSRLLGGAKRFNQICKELQINTKSLTDTLRHLEQYGMIRRQVYPTVPVTVEYSLTEKGRDFRQVLLAMESWGEKWLSTKEKTLKQKR